MKESLNVEALKERGFERRKCESCGSAIWTTGSGTCGEPPCGSYSFLGRKRAELDIPGLRKRYLKWFGDRGHEPVSRYPIVARWKPDTFFTGASIYCFQPWVLSGDSEPPANPLVISQPSFRAEDLENIGLGTARHMSTFEMMAHHSFYPLPGNPYWNERTVELCLGWLKSLGLKDGEIVFKEGWWEGGGNAGPCFEVIVGGNEIATLVFMEYEGPLDGKYRKMDIKVVDTGYGLERHLWLLSGAPTVYDASYPEVVRFLEKTAGVKKDEEAFRWFCSFAGKIEGGNPEKARKEIVGLVARKTGWDEGELMKLVLKYHSIYQVADHAKALLFVLADGVVPSNVGEGYVARLLARRSFREASAIGADLERVIELHARTLGLPGLQESLEEVFRILSAERKKYERVLSEGRKIVRKIEKKTGGVFSAETLVKLYESHGILPGDVVKFASVRVEIGDTETRLAAKGPSGKIGPETELSCPVDTEKLEEEAEVLRASGKEVVLSRTCFYPRGGGQEPDRGFMEKNGERYRVVEVVKSGKEVIHIVDRPGLKPGDRVRCLVDRERRFRLSAHHTAAHIINYAGRKVLGNHVWQHSAFKDENGARIDLTHFEALEDREVEVMEREANEVVKRGLPVTKRLLPRSEAERLYGFRIYQGGVPIGKKIRIVSINDIDHQACGGTHVNSTGEIKEIIITGTEKPQDGVVRINFVAGPAAVEYRERARKTLEECSKILGSEDVLGAAAELKKKREEKEKRISRLRKRLAKAVAEVGTGPVWVVHGDMKYVTEICRHLSERERAGAVFGIDDRIYVAVFSNTPDIDAGKVAAELSRILGGNGGGSPTFGRGSGLKRENLETAVKAAEGELREAGKNAP